MFIENLIATLQKHSQDDISISFCEANKMWIVGFWMKEIDNYVRTMEDTLPGALFAALERARVQKS